MLASALIKRLLYWGAGLGGHFNSLDNIFSDFLAPLFGKISQN